MRGCDSTDVTVRVTVRDCMCASAALCAGVPLHSRAANRVSREGRGDSLSSLLSQPQNGRGAQRGGSRVGGLTPASAALWRRLQVPRGGAEAPPGLRHWRGGGRDRPGSGRWRRHRRGPAGVGCSRPARSESPRREPANPAPRLARRQSVNVPGRPAWSAPVLASPRPTAVSASERGHSRLASFPARAAARGSRS